LPWNVSRPFAAFIFSALISAPSHAADVTVTSAEITGGRLVVAGTAKSAGVKLALDDEYNATANSKKAFTFSVIYLPGNCTVSVAQAGSSAAPVRHAVARCMPRALTPQGDWTSTAAYVVNDVVTQGGSVWRAKAANKNKKPSSNATAWVKFIAKGDPGTAGTRGAQGPQGDTGTQGPPGAASVTPGPQGPRGPDGLQGPQGDAGSQGPAGSDGNAGAQGPAGVDFGVGTNVPGVQSNGLVASQIPHGTATVWGTPDFEPDNTYTIVSPNALLLADLSVTPTIHDGGSNDVSSSVDMGVCARKHLDGGAFGPYQVVGTLPGGSLGTATATNSLGTDYKYNRLFVPIGSVLGLGTFDLIFCAGTALTPDASWTLSSTGAAVNLVVIQ